MPWRFVDYWKMTHDADLSQYRQTLRAEGLRADTRGRERAGMPVHRETR